MAKPKLVVGEDPVLIAFKAQQDLAAELDAHVSETQSSRSAVIRQALRQFLEQEVAAS